MPATKTALIIDDDATYREFVAEMLREHGWQVLLAGDGEEGIKVAKTNRPRVVLCDLLMPRCNGFQVCRALREEPSLNRTKIVVTSGRQFASDLQSASQAGADEYLTKPIDAGQLVLLLARLSEDPVPAKSRPESAEAAAAPVAARLKFWGVRGSIPTPGPTTLEYGGNTSCVELRADGQFIILDAGTGLRMLGRELVREFGEQALDLTLLLTHTHWDHIQGLPFFLPVYKPQNQLRILGYEGARHGLASVLTGQMESPFFPIGLSQVPANIRIEELKDLSFNLDSIRVQTCFANHPGVCVGYRVFTSCGSVAFFPDNEPYASADSGREGGAAATEFARNESKKLVEFLRGADVIIMDAQYDRDEYRRHVGWGHGCIDDVVALAIQAEAKRLFLFHHDPEHDDAKIAQMAEQARQIVASKGATLQVEAAREGLTLELPPLPSEGLPARPSASTVPSAGAASA